MQVHKQFVPWAKLNYKIYTSTAADTINFYTDNFSNVKFLGLLLFFFLALGYHFIVVLFLSFSDSWLYQFKNNCAGPQTICTMSKIELQNLHFNCCLHMLNHVPFATHDINIFNPHMAGLEKKKHEFQCVLWASRSHMWLASSHFLLILVNDFVRGWLAYTLAHWVNEL